LTRASITFERNFSEMDCRVKPGNDEKKVAGKVDGRC
jgi:hypothetical protein